MKLSSATLLAMFALSSSAQAQFNYVTNGNFQIGSLGGWTLEAGNAQVNTSGGFAALSGSFFRLSQVLPLPSTSQQASYTLTFLWSLESTIFTLPVQGIIASINSNNGLLDYSSTFNLQPNSMTTFATYSMTFNATGPVLLAFSKVVGPSSNISQYLDNVVVAIPEPRTYALFLMGGLFIFLQTTRTSPRWATAA